MYGNMEYENIWRNDSQTDFVWDVIYENYPTPPPFPFDVITMSEQVVDLAW